MRSAQRFIYSTILLLLSTRAANAVFYTVTLLHPPGFSASQAVAVSGNSQGGSGNGTGTGSPTHALLWSGTAASVVDLHTPGLPFNSSSEVRGVSGNTQVGYVDPGDTGEPHAA